MKVKFFAGSKGQKNRHDRSSTVFSTMDIGKQVPVLCLPMLPGEKVRLNYAQFTRMSPLAVPTLGRLTMRARAFFVPYRVVCPQFNNFIADVPDSTLDKDLPYITNAQLVRYFSQIASHQRSDVWDDSDIDSLSSFLSIVDNVGSYGYDFIVTETGGDKVYVRLTSVGRWFYSVLLGLGYRINWSYNDPSQFDAMPLLAFMRIYYDYMYPSAYVMQGGYGSMFDSHINSQFGSTDVQVYTFLSNAVQLMFDAYDKDFYNSAWKALNSVNGLNPFDASSGNVVMPVPQSIATSSNSLGVVVNSSRVLSRMSLASDTTTMSAYALRVLQAVSDFATRHNLVGSRFLERMRAEQGFVTKEQTHDYCDYLKSWQDDVQISDVTATTAGDVSNPITHSSQYQELGEQAGKGIGAGNGNLTYDASEHGFLIVIASMVPYNGYYQGRKPWTKRHTDRLSFYHEEFDGLSMVALPNDELFAEYWNNDDYNAGLNNGGKPDGIFGYVPPYREYKMGFDNVIGDFMVKSNATGLSSYHTMRVLPIPAGSYPNSIMYSGSASDPFTYKGMLSLGADFLRIKQQDYVRIFASDSEPYEGTGDPNDRVIGVADHFISIFRFDIQSTSGAKSFSESIPFFDKSGKLITADYEGTQVG